MPESGASRGQSSDMSTLAMVPTHEPGRKSTAIGMRVHR